MVLAGVDAVEKGVQYRFVRHISDTGKRLRIEVSIRGQTILYDVESATILLCGHQAGQVVGAHLCVIEEILTLQKGVNQRVKFPDVAKCLEDIGSSEHPPALAVGQVVARVYLMRVLSVEVVRKRIVSGQKQEALVSVVAVQVNDAMCDIEGEVT